MINAVFRRLDFSLSPAPKFATSATMNFWRRSPRRDGSGLQARQIQSNRIVAPKMIRSGQLASPEEVERFHREAEAAANLQHPNIVAIHEVGEHERQHYFSMDYVEGKSLAQMNRKTPLTIKRSCTICSTDRRGH